MYWHCACYGGAPEVNVYNIILLEIKTPLLKLLQTFTSITPFNGGGPAYCLDISEKKLAWGLGLFLLVISTHNH